MIYVKRFLGCIFVAVLIASCSTFCFASHGEISIPSNYLLPERLQDYVDQGDFASAYTVLSLVTGRVDGLFRVAFGDDSAVWADAGMSMHYTLSDLQRGVGGDNLDTFCGYVNQAVSITLPQSVDFL